MNKEYVNSNLKKVEAWSKIISTVFIAAASVIVTWIYNESTLEQQKILSESKAAQEKILTETALQQEKLLQQQDINTAKIKAIREFIPHLVSMDNNEKKTALLVLDSMGYSDFVIKFSSSDQTRGSKEAGDIVNSRSESSSETPVIESMVTTKEKELGWVYLGDWSDSKKEWETKYFDFEKVSNPEANNAIKQLITVSKLTGSINVRMSPPTIFGKLGKVSGILHSGSQVRILEIKEWSSSGYFWARVEG